MSEYLEQLFSLRGHIAIVNDASTKLGSAIVRGLAQSGAIVCGTKEQLRDCQEFKTTELSTDKIIDPNLKFQTLCDRLYEKYSKFNLLINIEEINTPSRSPELADSFATADSFSQGVEMQLAGITQASKIAARKIKQSGGGSILNIISIKNPMGFPDDSSYIATKNALLMITKKLAIDLIKDNVRVNNLVIGYAASASGDREQTVQHRFERDLIATTIYLASANSSSITGQDLFLVGNKTTVEPN